MRKSTHTPEAEIVQRKLVEMRKAAGLTQRQLAARLEREPSFVWRIENGERRKIMIRSVPWHTRQFDRMYDLLRQRKQIRETGLGESTILAMRARHVMDVSTDVMRQDPLGVVTPGCDCAFCKRRRR